MNNQSSIRNSKLKDDSNQNNPKSDSTIKEKRDFIGISKENEVNKNNLNHQYQSSTFSSIVKLKNEPFENKKGLLIKKRLMSKKNKQILKDEKSKVNKTADDNYNIENIEEKINFNENIDVCKSMNYLPSLKTISYNELNKSTTELSELVLNQNQMNANNNCANSRNVAAESKINNASDIELDTNKDYVSKMSRNITSFGKRDNDDNINSLNSIVMSYDSNTYINQIKNLSSNNENPFKELSSMRAGSIALLDDSCYKFGLNQSENMTMEEKLKLEEKNALESNLNMNMSNLSFQNNSEMNQLIFKNSRQKNIKENDLSKRYKFIQ